MVLGIRIRSTTLLALGILAGVDAKRSSKVIQGDGGLPVVDLGYGLQRATKFNSTEKLYTFSNIRYAAPPVGDLRWRKPRVPEVNRSVIDDGSVGRLCPQATTGWATIAEEFVISYLVGFPLPAPGPLPPFKAPSQDPSTTEDCLFLDVTVPEKVFNASDDGKGAPVLVWIFGGGFVGGDKASKSDSDPTGLIRRSQEGIVYVAINYRLGAFGWLGGDDVNNDGDANAGLWDQRLALQWVQDHISDFGGDPDRVTIMGESAGGGSVMHHITAFGGNGDPLFHQAIPQSPGFTPIVQQQEEGSDLSSFLSYLNASSIDQARKLPSQALINANVQQIGNAPYGSFIYGPTVDGTLIPALPSQLLADGSFHKSVRVLAGHNADEGLLFTNPNAVDPATFIPNFQKSIPSITPESLVYLNDTLYPTTAFKDQITRQAQAASDVAFLCNVYALAAHTQDSYVYEFSIFPALHGLDVPYTFYDEYGSSPSSIFSSLQPPSSPASRIKRHLLKDRRSGSLQARATVVEAAITLQEWIVNFVMTGYPKSTAGPAFVNYAANQTILRLTTDSAPPVMVTDDISRHRCEWWDAAKFEESP